MLDIEFGVYTTYKLLPLTFTILISIFSILIIEIFPKILTNLKFIRLGFNLYNFFSLRFHIEFIYNKYITDFMLNLGGKIVKNIDKGFVELLGPYGLEILFIKFSRLITIIHTKVITRYALYILLGLIFNTLMPILFVFYYKSLILILFISMVRVNVKLLFYKIKVV